MKKQQKGFRIFFLTALVFAVLFLVFACKHKTEVQKTNAEEFTVVFSPAGPGGDITATVDGTPISSHAKVGKGKKVLFSASVNDGFELDKWTGATENESEPLKAFLIVEKDIEVKAYFQTILQGDPADAGIINYLLLVGIEQNGGTGTKASDEQTNEIFKGKNLCIDIKGPGATLLLASSTTKWKSVYINEEKIPHGGPAMQFKSVSVHTLTLPEVNKKEAYKIVITAENGKTTQLNFRVKRIPGKVDIPFLSLSIQDEVVGKENYVKLFDASKPDEPAIIGYEPTKVEALCRKNFIKSITINGQNRPLKTKFIAGQEAWYADLNITGVKPSGKNIHIIIEPKDEYANDFNTINWTFKLMYNNPAPIIATFRINGKAERLEKDDGEPASRIIDITGQYMNLLLQSDERMSRVLINGEDVSSNISQGKALLSSVRLDTSKPEGMDIKITIEPEDKAKLTTSVYKAKIRGTNGKEAISPKLFINDYQDFPKATFWDKITDLSDPPTVEVFGNTANIKMHISQYDLQFLLQKIQINGEDIQLIHAPGFGFVLDFFLAEKTFDLDAAEPKEVTIKFIPKNNGFAEESNWRFKIRGTNKHPPFPNSFIKVFSINGKSNFDPEFKDHLTDGNNPVYGIDGTEAAISVGVEGIGLTDANTIEKVIFTMDSEPSAEIMPDPVNDGGRVLYIAKHKFAITNEHDMKIEIIPIDKNKYSSLIYTFKLKNSGLNPEIPKIYFHVEHKKQSSGYKNEFYQQAAILDVRYFDDIKPEIEKVEIGEKDGLLTECEGKTVKNTEGKVMYVAGKIIMLPTDSYKEFIIKVTPKNTAAYRVTECVYTLKGRFISDSNAEFLEQQGIPVSSILEFYDKKNHYAEEYGAKKVKINARTRNVKAKVKYKFTDPDGNMIAAPGDTSPQEKELINSDGIHSSEIDFYENKPSNLVFWVVAENGITTDDKNGRKELNANAIELRWDYDAKSEGQAFTNIAYDEIAIDKTKAVSGKIYVVFKILKEEIDVVKCKVDPNYGYASYQTPPVKLGSAADLYQWYKTQIDISSLKNSSGTLEIALPILQKNISCFTYKVKIKLAP